MPRIAAIFLDDGGVLNDNRVRGPQWRKLVGEFFPPILGGTPEAWAGANRVVFDRIFAESFGDMNMGFQSNGYNTWWRSYQVRWLREMAAEVGVKAPRDEQAIFELAIEACRYINPRVQAAIDGGKEAVGELATATLYTASSGHSEELDGMLRGMGLRQHFKTLYGPDLVNQFKSSVAYYEKVFAHAGVDPASALVVDDSEKAIVWADAAGAKTCLVAPARPPRCNAGAVIASLAELPELLEELA